MLSGVVLKWGVAEWRGVHQAEEVGQASPRWSGNASLTVKALFNYDPQSPDELRYPSTLDLM